VAELWWLAVSAGLLLLVGPVGVLILVVDGVAVVNGWWLFPIVGAALGGVAALAWFVSVSVRRHVVLHKVPR
jgi:hypothetical protein